MRPRHSGYSPVETLLEHILDRRRRAARMRTFGIGGGAGRTAAAGPHGGACARRNHGRRRPAPATQDHDGCSDCRWSIACNAWRRNGLGDHEPNCGTDGWRHDHRAALVVVRLARRLRPNAASAIGVMTTNFTVPRRQQQRKWPCVVHSTLLNEGLQDGRNIPAGTSRHS